MSFVKFLKKTSLKLICTGNPPQVHRKRIVLILLAAAAMTSAKAQMPLRASFFPARQSTASSSPLYVQKAVPLDGRVLYETNDHGLKRGKTLVAVGGALQAAGIALIVTGVHQNQNYTPQNPGALHPDDGGGDPLIYGGVAVLAAGTGVAVPGIVVWIRAVNKEKREMELQQSLGFNLSPMPSLIYRF